MSSFLDLKGTRFGRLLVVKYMGKNKRGLSIWSCQCDCGNITHPISTGDLRYGHTRSCGCYRKDRMSEICKKYNTYDLSREFGIGYTSKGEEFYFDLDDYDLIKDYYWSLKNDQGHGRGYVVSQKIKMHRLILGILEHPEIIPDHENRNKQDNRKNNLRIATQSQNTANGSLRSNNTSGVIGVYHVKNKEYPNYSKWNAKIEKNGITYDLGIFETFEEAIKARLMAEKEIFGEFAPQKHLFEKYGIE